MDVLYDNQSGAAYVLVSSVKGTVCVYHLNLEGASYMSDLTDAKGLGWERALKVDPPVLRLYGMYIYNHELYELLILDILMHDINKYKLNQFEDVCWFDVPICWFLQVATKVWSEPPAALLRRASSLVERMAIFVSGGTEC